MDVQSLNLQSSGCVPRGGVAAWHGSSVFVFEGTFALIFIAAIIWFIFLPALTDD